MNTQEIADRLAAMHTELVRKINGQPFLEMSLDVRQSGKCNVAVYRDYNDGDYTIGGGEGPSPEGALDAAAAIIANMPEPEQRDLHDFMKALGKVIDLGHAKGIPVDFVNPLKSTMERLSSNAIAKVSA